MKVSYNWLKDYVEINLPPEKLAAALTATGLKVEAIEERGDIDDSVLGIEVTSNRADCLSIVGTAREVAAVTGRKVVIPKSVFVESSNDMSSQLIKVSVECRDKCKRYTARVIEGVKISESPDWLKKRLSAAGIRPVNNIVDITNFVLLELGQPLHAFDYDKLKGNTITVRYAQKGEKILTIDGAERTLNNEMVVITDEGGPIAIGGVMGGKQTEVSAGTRRILLESAHFDQVSIRRTSRALGLGSESSYRFERGVDIEGITAASNRACYLMTELKCGIPVTGIVDVGRKKVKGRSITINPGHIESVLGYRIGKRKVKQILELLSFKVTARKDCFVVDVPTFRTDVQEEVDLVEEVARIHGYDKIPSTLPEFVCVPHETDIAERAGRIAIDTLVSCGACQIITYSLLSGELCRKASVDLSPAVRLKNPLSSEQEMMRTSLLTGFMDVVARNLNRQNKNLFLFEIGRVFVDGDRRPVETTDIGICMSGLWMDNWRTKGLPFDFYYMKGTVEVLFDRLGAGSPQLEPFPQPVFLAGESAEVVAKNGPVGIMGQINPQTLERFDIGQPVFFCELKFDGLLSLVNFEKIYQPLSKYPSVIRDIALVVDRKLASQEIVDLIRQTGNEMVHGVRLFDVYSGEQIPGEKKSLAYSIEYRAADRTLRNEEVITIHERIIQELERKLNAKVRGA
jgi:phenylalanyl-tRNA synthetase beta chain